MSNAAEQIDYEESDLGRQFVTFQVAKERFALPMQEVAEIIRLPETIGVPLTSKYLMGLANLRGNVLPILDLRLVLDLDEVAYSDATRVVVINKSSGSLGLVVDRVSRVLDVDESVIEGTEQLQTSTDTLFLTGVIRDNDQLIQMLDIEQLLHIHFQANDSKKGRHQTQQTASPSQEIEEYDEQNQLVSFSVEDQEYAFDLLSVEEIVRVSNDISEIPGSEPHVLGMIDLRGRILPLVCLRQMFGLTPQPINESHRILVVSIRSAGGIIHSIGILVDDVREVLHVPQHLRDKVPSLLNHNEKEKDIEAVCRLNNGTRLVSILNAEAMFAGQNILTSHSNQSQNQAMSDTTTEDEQLDNETQMVVFKLAEQEYGITIDHVREITRVPDQMSKVPKTPDFIEGMVNLRGTVLPVLDMRSRFGIERMQPNERQRILVLNINGQSTGFVMDSVVEVLRLNRQHIEPAPELSEDQTRMMGQVVNLKEEKRMIQVIEAEALLNTDESQKIQAINSNEIS